MGAVIGIDPGWKTMGLSIKRDGLAPVTRFFEPHKSESITGFMVLRLIPMLTTWTSRDRITDVYMERFVAYKGIHSDATEQILMLIGALQYQFGATGSNVHMVRAIDWKPKICKYLVRTQGFDNPSTTFDKAFSLAAAKALSGTDVVTDHEADALCLSYLSDIDFSTRKNEISKLTTTERIVNDNQGYN